MHAWIFDVDGVLTHPDDKHHIDTFFLDQITTWLQKKDLVMFNTGRSIAWLEERIINQLEKRIGEKKIAKDLFENFFIVGEKGADWLFFTKTNEKKQIIDSSITIPKNLQEEVKKLVKEKFSETMFFDETKKTMISVEILANINLKLFHEQQKLLNDELEKLIQKYTLENELRLTPSIIATDIERKEVSKALGAQRIIDWIRNKQLTPEHFYTFGDSPSDIDMAKKFYKEYREVQKITFIYVGENLDWLKEDLPFAIKHYPGFNKGTIKFLKKLA